MWRSLWQTPAALTLIRSCVPDGCGGGWSTSFKGALKSATWKLFIAALPSRFFALVATLPRMSCRDKRGGALAYLYQGMMAGGELVRGQLAKFRHFVRTSLVGARTAGAKTAARGRSNRRWRRADGDAFGRPHIGIGHRDRLDQQRGIGMRGVREQLLGRTDL